jgi:glycopeptide antibiotics resistance protein
MANHRVPAGPAGEDPLEPRRHSPASGIREVTSVPLWCWWIAVVFAISLPWAGFTHVPQWSRVHWIPFTDPADKPRDVLANIALFVPFGYSFAGRRRSRFRLVEAVLAAAVVSLGAEATQLFSMLRYPSATDVSSAAIGALVGAAAGVTWPPTFPGSTPSKDRTAEEP